MSDGAIAYARFRLSYASRLPEGMGRPVLFEGISCFRFRGELIARYSESVRPRWRFGPAHLFGRGIGRILEKAAAAQNKLPEARPPLERFSPG